MNTEETPVNPGLRTWFSESVLVKLVLIGMLSLFLLIPSVAIQDLINERQERQKEVIAEVSDKWAGAQVLGGPVMVLPYKRSISQRDSAGRQSFKEMVSNVYILPETLEAHAKTSPTVLKRGIFDVIVYSSKIRVNGKFSGLELKKSGINPDLILWNKARVAIGLTDLKGLKNNPVIRLGDSSYTVEPDFTSLKLFGNNLIISPDLSVKKNPALNFSFELDLNGSENLSFMHMGRDTRVLVEGDWKNPSFSGRYLPETRSVTDGKFSASWTMPHFNRPLPQQWMEENNVPDTLSADQTFGVKFLVPVDDYQKTMRSAKYAILIILLTFISLFFTELITKRKVHLLQYVLIGSAMIIYYTLLLSFTEQFGFNLAYLVASAATVVLITSFLASLLNNRKTTLIFGGILTAFYSFIFVIIQLQDLALLFGSVGLFVIIAIMMYLSSKLDWSRRL